MKYVIFPSISDKCEFFTHIQIEKEAIKKYGAPLDIWIHYHVTDRENGATGNLSDEFKVSFRTKIFS
jgi:hypothetical protein